MICKRCGAALPSDGVTCIQCGTMMSKEQIEEQKKWITEKVRQSCSDNLARGNKKAADEDMKLYTLTLSILYDLALVFGDKEFTFEEFSAALSLIFSESNIKKEVGV